MSEGQKHRFSPFVDRTGMAILLVVGIILFGLWMAPVELAAQAVRENGPIEIASVILLGVGLIAAGWRFSRRPSWGWVSGAVMTLWGVLRELDFQRRFTYRSIESTGFYLRDIASLETKLIVLLILFPFGVAALHLLWLAKNETPAAFRNRERWVGFLGFGVILVLLAQFSEKVLGVVLLEEPLELGFAAFVVAMILTVGSRQKPSMDARNED